MHRSSTETARRRSRAAGAALITSLVPACVHDTAPVRPKPKADTEVVASWDFPPELGPTTLHLWPADKGAPQRSKHHLGTHTDADQLTATVEGADPYFVWHLETPTAAFAVHVELDAVDAGQVQVFWSTPRCPVFSEPCSATVSIGPGRQTLEYLLDPEDPLRELRLDLPDHVGARLVFRGVAVLRSDALGGSWAPNASIEDATLASGGLFLVAATPDPWLTVNTPGLDASRITAAELVLRTPDGAVPQLYWANSQGEFSEAASVFFSPADAGALTHRVALRGKGGWGGSIRALRLDPGVNPGRYIVERIALVRSSTD